MNEYIFGEWNGLLCVGVVCSREMRVHLLIIGNSPCTELLIKMGGIGKCCFNFIVAVKRGCCSLIKKWN